MSVLRIGGTMCPQKLCNYVKLLQRGFLQQRLPHRAVTCSSLHHIPQFHSYTTSCSSSEFLNINFTEFVQGQKSFSTTAIVHKSKGFDAKKLQRYNIYDPQGNYILTSEVFNVEKFCDAHKRYKFQAKEGNQSSDVEAGLESIQIVEKPAKDHMHAEKVKVIKIKSAEAPWVMDNIKRLLLGHGSVLIDIRGKQTTSIKQRINDEWISKLCTISTVKEEEKSVLLKIVMPDSINSTLFKQIFLETCAKDATYLKQVREFIAETAKAET